MLLWLSMYSVLIIKSSFSSLTDIVVDVDNNSFIIHHVDALYILNLGSGVTSTYMFLADASELLLVLAHAHT